MSYRWLRDGKPISGAWSSTYKVTKADIGRKLSLRVTARGPEGYTTSTATSVARTVAKVKPTVKVTVPTTATAGRTIKVTVRVTASGVTTKPTGKVTVRYGASSKTVNLVYAHEGKVTVTLPAMTRGDRTVRATYTPSSALAKYLTTAQSTAVTLRVR